MTSKPLAERTIAELRAQAAEYRRMAETARTLQIAESLRALADRFEGLADTREQEVHDKAHSAVDRDETGSPGICGHSDEPIV